MQNEVKKMIEKFTSRKFLLSIAGAITGILVIFNIDAGIVTDIAGAVTTLASIVIYIITEGRIDKAAVDEKCEGKKNAETD